MEPNKDPFLSDFYPDSDLEEEHSDSDGEDEGPRINTWHDVHPSNVSFSINNGRKKAFDRAKSDIEHVVERIKELSGVEDPTTADVMDIFFGEKALFTQTLARILGLENDRLTLWKFLQTIEKDDENSSNELWGIEVKSRVATDEISKEMKFQRKRHNLDSHLSKIYSETNEEEFHADIRKLTERTQILHHASVFNLTKMMFLVGDCDGRIIHGNAITFSEATLTNYGSTLDVMYNDTLSWAYKDVIDPNSSEFKRVSVIAANIPTIGGKDEFHSQFFLWKHMSTKEKLPLPPLKRLIPSIHATWNAFKSGSDTTTALMENHRFKHPHTNCNSRASSRLLLLAFVFIHRSLQAVTCDPDRHETLQQLRDAASKRYSFPKTLQCLLTYFENKVSTCRQENAGVPIVDYTIPTRTSRRLNAPLLLYVTPRTFDTPKYNHKSERNRRPDGSEYWNRILKCRQTGGFGVFAQYIGNRKEKTRPFRCWSCQKETHHMCFICRRPLCHTRIVVKDLEDLLAQEDAYKLQPFTKKDQSDPNLFWYGVKTCFMKEHMHTIEER